MRALTVTDIKFEGWADELARANVKLMKRWHQSGKTSRHGYQNTVFRVVDDLGLHVDDYMVEFSVDDSDIGSFWEWFHRDAIRSVHVFSADSSFRSLYVDCTTLFNKIDRPNEDVLVRLIPYPEFELDSVVGYSSALSKRIAIRGRRLKRLNRFSPQTVHSSST